MNASSPTKTVNILLVEDSPTDVLMTREALAQDQTVMTLHVVQDGVQAMAFLRREAPYGDAARPTVILLDLNLPRKDGREVLAEIKGDEKLKQIPVVVLTTSKADDDISKSYSLHANSYITKPVDYLNFVKVMSSVRHYWLNTVTLPADGTI